MGEVDLQRTKDGALVLMHDVTLVRTTDVRRRFPRRRPWRVRDFTYDEIRKLDAGGWMSYQYAGEPVPTLEELLVAMRGGRAGLLLEVKRPEQHPSIVRDLVQELGVMAGHLSTLGGGLVVQSFDVAAMKEHKTAAPHIPVGILGRPRVSNLPALASWADQVNPAHDTVGAVYVDRVKDAGLGCLVWTVDFPTWMGRAARIGADGIITNRPELLLQLQSTSRVRRAGS